MPQLKLSACIVYATAIAAMSSSDSHRPCIDPPTSSSISASKIPNSKLIFPEQNGILREIPAEKSCKIGKTDLDRKKYMERTDRIIESCDEQIQILQTKTLTYIYTTITGYETNQKIFLIHREDGQDGLTGLNPYTFQEVAATVYNYKETQKYTPPHIIQLSSNKWK